MTGAEDKLNGREAQRRETRQRVYGAAIAALEAQYRTKLFDRVEVP